LLAVVVLGLVFDSEKLAEATAAGWALRGAGLAAWESHDLTFFEIREPSGVCRLGRPLNTTTSSSLPRCGR
jgi:hypothetical protein